MMGPIVAGLAALGSSVTAAVYVNFSARVMPRLAALPAAEGIATMQHFNRVALRPPFMTAFFGSALLSAVLLYRTARAESRGWADWATAAGACLYLAGFGLTIAYNVPRNERLAALDAGSAEAAGYWQDYLAQWTAANSVRAALSVAAVLALVVGGVFAVVDGRRVVDGPRVLDGKGL